MRRLLVCLAMALVSALVGPRILGPQSRSASGPFLYEPPDGFVPMRSGDLDGAQAWVFDEAVDRRPLAIERAAVPVRAVVHHSNKEMSVEEADLATLASEMARAFETSCTWVHRRHELRTRTDGARIGLIEGDCNREVEMGNGAPTQQLRSRKLQLMFPDEKGTSILTASYPTDQAARWEPLFEATIQRARGVAIRVPSPPLWVFAAWAFAAAVLGWFATAIVWRKSRAQ